LAVYTIGFTKRSAEAFFETLKRAAITRVIDVRLNNVSQLAGYSKRDDLKYFAKTICGADYVHELRFAPTKAILDDYRKKKMDWDAYAAAFLRLLDHRNVSATVGRSMFEGAPVLLCSELRPERCHRRLVVEYLARHWGGIDIVHL
jgi:uncharacterized protein (DUF488 family)